MSGLFVALGLDELIGIPFQLFMGLFFGCMFGGMATMIMYERKLKRVYHTHLNELSIRRGWSLSPDPNEGYGNDDIHLDYQVGSKHRTERIQIRFSGHGTLNYDYVRGLLVPRSADIAMVSGSTHYGVDAHRALDAIKTEFEPNGLSIISIRAGSAGYENTIAVSIGVEGYTLDVLDRFLDACEGLLNVLTKPSVTPVEVMADGRADE